MASLLNMSGSALIGAKHDDGHEYVDLGLPSGLLWATCNIGANSPEEAGLYFAWGETTGYASAADRNTALGRTDGFSQASYNAGSASSISTDLTLENDAANVYWGGGWRMHTSLEFKELTDNCTSVWTTENGVNGRRFTSKNNGNSIFIPAAGYYNGTTFHDYGSLGFYWSALRYSNSNGYIIYFGSGIVSQGNYSRKHGFSVRPVKSV